MATLKKYNLAGKEVGEVTIEDALLKKGANSQMIKDYIVALRKNARQWSAHTKTRAEMVCSGKKPYQQKGTGNARQGYLAAPQFRGGGRAHGPRAKFDQHVKINKKERQAAIRHLLAEKIQSNQLIVLSSEPMKAPKTQKVAAFLEGREMGKKRVLFLDSPQSKGSEVFVKSMRNIPKTQYMLMPNQGGNVSGYDIATASRVVVFEPAVEQLVKILEG